MRSVPNSTSRLGPAPPASNNTTVLDKMDDVTHYIHSQTSQHTAQLPEHIPVDPGISLNIQEETGSRILTVMHPSYPTQNCRQVSVSTEGHISESVGGWDQELLATGMPGELTEEDGRLAAALMAVHFAHAKQPLLHDIGSMPKVAHVRQDVESSVLMDGSIRTIFNGQNMSEQTEPLVINVPHLPPLPPLPPLQNMKSCETWYQAHADKTSKNDQQLMTEAEQLELASSSAAQTRQNKKSLPHKKRISKKLKRNGNSTPQQDVVIIDCTDEVQEEILPDNFVPSNHDETTHEVRPMLICQICGDFYGEDQYKFYTHLKQHYEPHGTTIIIENPVSQMNNSDLTIDKINNCIVDNVTPLPDALVELSLENTMSNKMSVYHNTEKHVLYTSGDKTLSYMGNKCTYSTAVSEKVHFTHKEMYDEELEKSSIFSCTRCNKSFRKQRSCEAHIKEAHSKIDELSEFSEPEDLMEGITVMVEGAAEEGEGDEGAGGAPAFTPHLTIENGQVHQEHIKHWCMRDIGMSEDMPVEEGCEHTPGSEGTPGYMCAVCSVSLPTRDACNEHMNQCSMHLKEEVLQRMFETEVETENQPLTPNMMLENPDIPTPSPEQLPNRPENIEEPPQLPNVKVGANKLKQYICQECNRVFNHRNSLLYHIRSHKRPSFKCEICDKGFMTQSALKIHSRQHDGIKPYKCTVCGRDFRQWGDLKYHIVSLHSNKKQFKCEYCKKEFARKYSLNIHRKIHTGVRDYNCEYCNKTFRASSHRQVHMRIHTGEKPYKCEECGKAFRVAGDLRRHEPIHKKIRERIVHKPNVIKSAKKSPRSKTKIVFLNEQDKEKKDIKTEPKTVQASCEIIEHKKDNLVLGKVKDSKLLSDYLKQKNRKGNENVTKYVLYPIESDSSSSKIMKNNKMCESPPKNITPFEHFKKMLKRDESEQSDCEENIVFLERLSTIYNTEPV